MVGRKLKAKRSKVFHESYVRYCSRRNITPLRSVLRGCDAKKLDLCVDRIKYKDWPPILDSLSSDLSLHSVSVRCRLRYANVLDMDCERLVRETVQPTILTKMMLSSSSLVEAIVVLLGRTKSLTTLQIAGLPMAEYLDTLCKALHTNTSLQHLYLGGCGIGDSGCLVICRAVRSLLNLRTLDLSRCRLTEIGAGYIAELIKFQKIHRYSENWLYILRYRPPELDSMAGLRRVVVSGNQLGDQGLLALLEEMRDDLWIKALELDIQIIED